MSRLKFNLINMTIDWKFVQLVAGVLTGVLFIITAYATWKVTREDGFAKKLGEERDALSGKLTPEPHDGNEVITFKYGNNFMNYSKLEFLTYGARTPFYLSGKEPIKIWLKDDRLLISGTFESLDGTIVSEIVENEWQINPNNYFKRNYDKTALEVVDKSGLLKFQVELKGQNEIAFNGFFKSGPHYYQIPNNKPLYMISEKEIKKMADIRKLSESVPLLFKYPEQTYFGIRAQNE